MLVLSRKKGQSILLDNDIEIYVSIIEGDTVKLGIRAPENVVILRKELVEEVQSNNREARLIEFNEELIKIIKKVE